jgi:chromosome segregation ATPase
MGSIAQDLRGSIDQAYRELVIRVSDGDIDVDECIQTLSHAQRSPEQFEADVLRLHSRREAAEQVARAGQLGQQIEAARDKVLAARRIKEAAFAAVSAANHAVKHLADNRDTRRALRAVRVELENARDDLSEATAEIDRLRAEQERLYKPAQECLRKTGLGHDALVPENFALSE